MSMTINEILTQLIDAAMCRDVPDGATISESLSMLKEAVARGGGLALRGELPDACGETLAEARAYADAKVAEASLAAAEFAGVAEAWAALPANPSNGNIYVVNEAHAGHPSGTPWIWEGASSEWKALDALLDLSGYATEEYVDEALSGLSDDYDDLENKPLMRAVTVSPDAKTRSVMYADIRATGGLEPREDGNYGLPDLFNDYSDVFRSPGFPRSGVPAGYLMAGGGGLFDAAMDVSFAGDDMTLDLFSSEPGAAPRVAVGAHVATVRVSLRSGDATVVDRMDDSGFYALGFYLPEAMSVDEGWFFADSGEKAATEEYVRECVDRALAEAAGAGGGQGGE